jgi:hypothetical protein
MSPWSGNGGHFTPFLADGFVLCNSACDENDKANVIWHGVPSAQ